MSGKRGDAVYITPMHLHMNAGDCSSLEVAAFFRLRLFEICKGSIPDDERRTARVLRCTVRQWRQWAPAVLKLLELEKVRPVISPTRPITPRRELDVSPGVWLTLRRAVFARDGNRCTYCGSGEQPLECDHVIPVSRGGASTLDNLTTACKPCNRSKRDFTAAEWMGEV